MRNIYLCIYASSIFPFSLLYTSLCTLELTLFTFACSNLTFKSCLSRTAKHSDIMMHSEQLSKFPKKCIILRSWTIFEKKFLVKGLTSTENLEKNIQKCWFLGQTFFPNLARLWCCTIYFLQHQAVFVWYLFGIFFIDWTIISF